MYTHNMLLALVFLTSIICCWATTTVVEISNDNKRNDSITTNYMANYKLSDKSERKYLNYVRLLDGQCHNCSTYKCTDNKLNMGGSEWCIMLFPDALAHCDSDPNCGGYTMTTAGWFHKQYDKNGQVAVHLTKVGEKPFNCSFSEWSSYEKQNIARDSPVIYGRTTCPNSDHTDKLNNFNYIFESNSNVVNENEQYLCKSHAQNLDTKDSNCILLIADAVTHCNSDDQCLGFSINTDEDWQTTYSKNGMQAVQLFGKGGTYKPNQMWRSFKKQS
ncbi:unnamed protein product [Adineta steineri]|uniref:Uncharacterized protein n=1 Tax=Adineta steineri TaxID=433720 RepID=A0A815EPG2_9BILA|nr:unnamed protein product [Adineta steineri]CAF1382847.1 unnamed protein product [Adineta steineri]CAF3936907.1 unnamed protein product [Adineta steineri]